ncbi:N-acyl-D-amino-acid deacylase family protein [Sphingomonas sp. C3-2]|uniref:N-acyl-D-amino-acid deacylase family protein n=1 Tax=Sphingomonas sp. C3-2 TaxID=3062169 RepID=UPI00294B34D4|nr:amidohydrolase family protein [Sphingomonas sp. C3-2]WOK36284.1 amidohydrolase family protein [Sphingomonas sp. C3-2]
MTVSVDLLIRGGSVADGSGAPIREMDVAIKDGRIAAMGPSLSCRADEEIDARGLLVTPGFVDIHTHYDGQVTWENSVRPSSVHGVTTVLMGNCGVGFAPCRPGDRDRLVRLMEGVEDLPEIVLTTGLPWNWETFPDYMNALSGRRFDADVATQIPHAALRVFVMGQRAAYREEATEADCAAMARLAGEAIDAGALGFGTSRTLNHRASDGSLIPTLTAAENELKAIAGALRAKGSGVLQAVSDFADVDTELALFRRVMEQSGRPLSLSVMQWHTAPEKWRTIVDWMDQCTADGLEVRAQVSGRPVGMMLGFDLSYHPFVFTPTFKKLAALPREQRLGALRSADVRAQILSEEFDPNDFMGAGLLRLWDAMYPLGEQPDYEPAPNSHVAGRAAAMGVDPASLAYDLMLEQDGQAVLMLPSVNYAFGSLDVAGEMLRHPRSVYGLGDGGAHLGFLCDASLPTFMLEYWARDRKASRLSVEDVVRGLSHETARAIGLNDRGLLRSGYKADINVIDFDRLKLGPPRVTNDLPAGGRRMVQQASGYRATILNGQIVARDDTATGALPGRLVRGAKAA